MNYIVTKSLIALKNWCGRVRMFSKVIAKESLVSVEYEKKKIACYTKCDCRLK